MTVLSLIERAIDLRKENDKRITGAFLESFKAMSLDEKKTAFLALDETRQRELLGFLSVVELEAIKTKLMA